MQPEDIDNFHKLKNQFGSYTYLTDKKIAELEEQLLKKESPDSNLDKRLKELEQARLVQIKLNTKFLDHLAAKPKKEEPKVTKFSLLDIFK